MTTMADLRAKAESRGHKPLRMAERDHASLLWLYGAAEGRTCSECPHFERRWFKCGLARVTLSSASDWRAGWQACGRVDDGGGA